MHKRGAPRPATPKRLRPSGSGLWRCKINFSFCSASQGSGYTFKFISEQRACLQVEGTAEEKKEEGLKAEF